MQLYFIIEDDFHIAYLVDKISQTIPHRDSSIHQCHIIVRNKRHLNAETLSILHNHLGGKKDLTDDDLFALQKAYHGELSLAEKALINMYGVPHTHPLSLAANYSFHDLNSEELMNWLDYKSKNTSLAALIFLDCLLLPPLVKPISK